MSRLEGKDLKDFWVQETPSGTINGSNTAFTISQTPNEIESVQVYLDGLRQKYTQDYTVSGTTITFVVAPVTDQELWCEYVRNRGE